MLIDDVVHALNARTWPEYVTQRYGSHIGEVVAPTLRPVIGAALGDEPSTAGSLPIGASKVGGLPHVDGSFAWPTEDDSQEPLAFVCQVNLGSAPPACAAAGLPRRGMLYLFSIYDSDRAYGYEIDDSTASVLYVPDPGPLAPASAPATLDDDGVLVERPLTLGASLLCEESLGEDGYDSARFDYEVERALDEEIVRHGGVPCGVVRMLGNPHPFRSETKEQIGEGETLLLYLNGYAVARHAFGEGEFLLVIDRQALADGRLGAASVIFEPGT